MSGAIKPLSLEELCLLLRDVFGGDAEIHLRIGADNSISIIRASAAAFGTMPVGERGEPDEDTAPFLISTATLRRLASRKDKTRSKKEDYYG